MPHTRQRTQAWEGFKIGLRLLRLYRTRTQLVIGSRKGRQRLFLRSTLINTRPSRRHPTTWIQYHQASLRSPARPLRNTNKAYHMTGPSSSKEWKKNPPQRHRGHRDDELPYTGLPDTDTSAKFAAENTHSPRALRGIDERCTRLTCVGIAAYSNGLAPTCSGNI